MELSLLPLAAILLLLSGASGRTPLAEGPSASAALIRLWLAGDHAQGDLSTARRAGVAKAPRAIATFRRTTDNYKQAQLVRGVQVASQRLTRVLLRGRFRVPSATFASTAPPQA